MIREDVQTMKRSVDALVALLEDWASWQKGYRLKLGFPSCSAGFASVGSVSNESEPCLYERAEDGAIMGTVDAVIQDLPPAQSAAILRRYGVAAVFRFPRDNYEQCLLEAHERLIVELPRNGVIVL